MIHELTRLYRALHNAVRDFPKLEKFSLGEMMERILLECIEACFLGTTLSPGPHKLHQVAMASAKFDALKLFIRVSVDTKCLRNETYIKLIPILGTIGAMLGGWIKSVKAWSGNQNQKQT